MEVMPLHQSISVYVLKQALGLAVLKTTVRAAEHLYKVAATRSEMLYTMKPHDIM